MTRKELASTFRRLHTQRPLVLPNAWDVSSARIIERAGAQAIATTSAGISWAHGRRDGQRLPRSWAVQAVRSIVQAVSTPVSADVESGYGTGTPDDVAETVEAIIEAGAVGINIEDAPGRDGAPLLAPEEHAARIRAARRAANNKGADLFINARIDVYLAAAEDPGSRLSTTLRRAELYLNAGADGIFVPAVTDPETIVALAADIDAPLNIMAGPGTPSVLELTDLGVARVSLGAAVALGAFGTIHRAVAETLGDGTYHNLEQGLSFAEANGLFADA